MIYDVHLIKGSFSLEAFFDREAFNIQSSISPKGKPFNVGLCNLFKIPLESLRFSRSFHEI
jgi:hypothetical protein